MKREMRYNVRAKNKRKIKTKKQKRNSDKRAVIEILENSLRKKRE
jgi:hypothetical protein